MYQFDEFMQERRYLLGVSEKTLAYYRWAFVSWAKYSADDPKTWLMTLRGRGLAATSCNTYICAMNTFWKWSGEPRHLDYLKEEEKLLQTFKTGDFRAIVEFKPKKFWEKRCHTLVCVLFDCGIRIAEGLGIRAADCDFDNLVISVLGKGNKHRLVPMSTELRKVLWRYRAAGGFRAEQLLFGTHVETRLSQRNFLRDFKKLALKLKITGVRVSPHTCRHFFACTYLRKGGDLFTLSRILGHTSISTTQIYLRSIGIEQVAEAHRKFSPLSRS
jgi:integrase/recombinase XerD